MHNDRKRSPFDQAMGVARAANKARKIWKLWMWIAAVLAVLLVGSAIVGGDDDDDDDLGMGHSVVAAVG